jgi:hypothetical protein
MSQVMSAFDSQFLEILELSDFWNESRQWDSSKHSSLGSFQMSGGRQAAMNENLNFL